MIMNQCFHLAPTSVNKHGVILFGHQRSASLPIRAVSITIFPCMLSDGNCGAPETRLEILRKNSVARSFRAHHKDIKSNRTREFMSGGKTMNAPPFMLYTDLARLVHLQLSRHHAASVKRLLNDAAKVATRSMFDRSMRLIRSMR